MAFGIYGSTGASFLSLGPLIGGFFSETMSWRWIFWINPPLMVVFTLVVLAVRIELRRDSWSKRIYIFDLFSLVGGLGMFVFAVMQGP